MMEDGVNRLPRWELQSHHSRSISRLKKLLGMEGIFHFVLLEFNDPAYRDRVIEHINALCRNFGILEVNAQTFPTYEDLEPILLATFKKYKALHLVGLDNWFTPPDGPSRIRGFNHHRETIAENCPGLPMLWLTGEGIQKITHDHLKESYALLDKIQHLVGISTVGLSWGELLCTRGQRREGLAVLRRSLDGFRQLKKEDMAARAEALIARFEANPQGSGEK